ncbi:serine/threonine protein phosphatase [Campylobacterota bacterium]|nr:serine/threonine protein phosphatase [Campylobacterota bacterium]
MTGKWESVLRLEKNRIGRDFVCGDIHGCFGVLEAGLKKLKFDIEKDRLFCVGDIIDRGPRSDLALFYLRQSWFFSVMGNHEYMFLMGHLECEEKEGYFDMHTANGGEWIYKIEPAKIADLITAVDTLPLIIQVGDTLIAHAAIPNAQSLEEIEKEPFEYIDTILWHRGKYPAFNIPEINRVYVGHTINSTPYESGKIINIDTGAFMKYRNGAGKLTIKQISRS